MTSQKFSIAQAAKIAGKARNTIKNRMNKGRLTWELDGGGNKVIDASELVRVFGDDCQFDRLDNRAGGKPVKKPESKAGTDLERELSDARREIERKNDIIRKLEEDKDYLKEELSGFRKMLPDLRGQKSEADKKLDMFEKMVLEMQEQNDNQAKQTKELMERVQMPWWQRWKKSS